MKYHLTPWIAALLSLPHEPADVAEPIVTSKYRVVGKLFTEQNLSDYRQKRRIEVKGKW